MFQEGSTYFNLETVFIENGMINGSKVFLELSKDGFVILITFKRVLTIFCSTPVYDQFDIKLKRMSSF